MTTVVHLTHLTKLLYNKPMTLFTKTILDLARRLRENDMSIVVLYVPLECLGHKTVEQLDRECPERASKFLDELLTSDPSEE